MDLLINKVSRGLYSFLFAYVGGCLGMCTLLASFGGLTFQEVFSIFLVPLTYGFPYTIGIGLGLIVKEFLHK